MSVNYEGKYGLEDKEEKTIDALLDESVAPNMDDEEELTENLFSLDMDEMNEEATRKATDIAERLAGYFIDEKYINEHPYIKNKIAQEIDAIRRMLKMLSVNEKAQDGILKLISMGMAKPQIFSSLTSLQTTMLNIQTKLDNSTKSLEDIFAKMQANSEQTFEDKDKEQNENGDMVSRGSREFIKRIVAQMNGKKIKPSDMTVATANYDGEEDLQKEDKESTTQYDPNSGEYFDPTTGEIKTGDMI